MRYLRGYVTTDGALKPGNRLAESPIYPQQSIQLFDLLDPYDLND